MRTLLLVRHGTTPAVRRAAFPSDEPLDVTARAAAAALAPTLGRIDTTYASPARAAVETAHALGHDPVATPDLADFDAGRWTGRSLAQVQDAEPDALADWLTDPDARPHGGESLSALGRRVARWLAAQVPLPPDRVIAVTHATAIRAAVADVLHLSHEATTRIDVAPLSVTEISVRAGRWRLGRLNWHLPAAPRGQRAQRDAT